MSAHGLEQLLRALDDLAIRTREQIRLQDQRPRGRPLSLILGAGGDILSQQRTGLSRYLAALRRPVVHTWLTIERHLPWTAGLLRGVGWVLRAMLKVITFGRV